MKLYSEQQMTDAFNAGGINALRQAANQRNPQDQRPVLTVEQYLIEVYPELILSDGVIKMLSEVSLDENPEIELMNKKEDIPV